MNNKFLIIKSLMDMNKTIYTPADGNYRVVAYDMDCIYNKESD